MLDITRHILRRATSAAALLFLLGTAARAQETPTGAPSLVELRRLIDEQKAALEVYQAALEAQKRQLEDQGREIAELRKKTDEASALALASYNQLAELQKPAEPTAAAAVEARLAQVEQERPPAPRAGEDDGDRGRVSRVPSASPAPTPGCASEAGYG